MIKVVPDTNVLVSATIVRGNEFLFLKQAQNKKFELYLSPPILEEYMDVLSRPKFEFSEDEIMSALDALLSFSNVIFPKERIDIIGEDPSDNRFLECASEAEADFLVSGDKHLLALKRYGRTRIVNTKEFLEEMEK